MINKAIEIITQELQKSNFGWVLNASDLTSTITLKGKIVKGVDKVKNYLDLIFEHSSRDRKNDFGPLYAFKKPHRAIEILKNKALPMVTLPEHSANDFTEQMEFIQRYQRNQGDYRGNQDQTAYTPVEGQAEIDKNYTNIFCFCRNFREERFWTDYAANSTGVALSFRFVSFSKNKDLDKVYEFRDVYYDDGYTFDFINEIRFKITSQLKLIFGINADENWFSYFYKRKKFQWENETRLAIHMPNLLPAFVEKGMRGDTLLQELDKYDFPNVPGRNGIYVPFDNFFFTVEVDEIICGKNISAKDFSDLERIAKSENLKIWKMK